jgi:serine/threonine protein kinase
MAIKNGRYEVFELLGTGATSRVEKAHDTLIGRTVALKTFLNGFGSHQLREQFLREAHIIGQLAHPSIVSLFDLGTDENGCPYFVMEYVEGHTLETALEAAPLPLEKAAAWGGDLATALDQAHLAGILHGDVKPANILITKEGRPKLGDFGIARFAAQAPTSDEVKGTPAFLSPEQIAEQKQDARSDLFSLGIILYLMTTGVHPFDADSVGAVCMKILSSTPAPPSRHNPSLPAEFDQIVMRCLAKAPAERFASAQELAAELYPLARTKKNAEPAASEVSSTARVPALATRRATRRTAVLPGNHAGRPRFWNKITSWWYQPLRGRTLWATGGSAAICVLLLVPAVGLLLQDSQRKSANQEMRAAAAASDSVSANLPTRRNDTESTEALGGPRETTSAPGVRNSPSAPDNLASDTTKEGSSFRGITRDSSADNVAARTAIVTTPVAANLASASHPIYAGTAAPFKAAIVPVSHLTSLKIAVISEVSDETLEVYSDNELLLTIPLESEHRGDTLRFICPVLAGNHRLRVVVSHDGKDTAAEKENDSELQAGGGNSMEVHVNRRAHLLVKHQTALEIIWPSRVVSSALQNPADAGARGSGPGR